MSTVASSRLACGADLAAIVRQVCDDAPAQDAEHQLGCPSCQAALASVRRLVGDVRTLAAEPIVVPPSFAAGVLRRLEAEERAVEVDAGTQGQTLVAERLVARVAREAASLVPDVLYASARARAVDGAGEGVALRLRLVVALGEPLPEVARAVRERVREDVERMTGLRTGRIEVHVDDVLEPGSG